VDSKDWVFGIKALFPDLCYPEDYIKFQLERASLKSKLKMEGGEKK
jgi:hypothetical protein